jgi:hypothetical protein
MSVSPGSHSLIKSSNVPREIPLVLFLCDAIHAHGRVLSKPMKRLLQHILVENVRKRSQS